MKGKRISSLLVIFFFTSSLIMSGCNTKSSENEVEKIDENFEISEVSDSSEKIEGDSEEKTDTQESENSNSEEKDFGDGQLVEEDEAIGETVTEFEQPIETGGQIIDCEIEPDEEYVKAALENQSSNDSETSSQVENSWYTDFCLEMSNLASALQTDGEIDIADRLKNLSNYYEKLNEFPQNKEACEDIIKIQDMVASGDYTNYQISDAIYIMLGKVQVTAQ